ncbi:MAG: TatD family hydrolase [Chitinophagales bacterium]
MIDTHCHIDQYPNPLDIANECERKNILTIGVTNLPSHFALGVKHLSNHAKVRLALGIHPLMIEQFYSEWPIFLENIDKTSYIGEIGLDFSREGFSTKYKQLDALKQILSVLKGRKKILSLHSRKAEKEVLQNLKLYKIEAAIFHWYSGPITLVDEICKAGYMFSINTAMIKSKSGQQIIKHIPQSHILTESDGPFIEYNGRSVKPSDVQKVLYHLAIEWNISFEQVEEIIASNYRRLLS